MFLCGFVSNVFTKIYSYLYWIFLTFFLIQPPLRHQPLPKFLPSSIYPFNNLLHALIERVSRHTSQDLSWFWTKPYKSLKKKPKKLNLILLMLFGFFFFLGVDVIFSCIPPYINEKLVNIILWKIMKIIIIRTYYKMVIFYINLL